MDESISIIIPTTKDSFLLRRAIKSALSQDYRNLEVIVVNDGKERISNIDNEKVTVIQGHKISKDALGYGSAGYARNFGLQISNSRYIAFLDDDDYYLPKKISRQILTMKEYNSRASCTEAYIGCLPYKLPMLCKTFSQYYKKIYDKKLFDINYSNIPNKITSDIIRHHNFVITSTTIFERSIINEAGNFRNLNIKGEFINGKLMHEDRDLWIRISEIEPLLYIQNPTIYYKRGSLKKINDKIKYFMKNGKH